MIPVLDNRKMQKADEYTQHTLGLSQEVLMERAALASYSVLSDAVSLKDKSILIVCGPGNNGGDGVALARILSERDIFPDVVILKKDGSEGLQKQLKILNAIYPDVGIMSTMPEEMYDVTVDAVFGISCNRKIEGEYKEVIDRINTMHDMGSFVMALDIPSGVDASTGQILGVGVKADLTVTFGTFKIGHLLYPGALYSGEVTLKDIGIPLSVMEEGAHVHIFHDDEIALPPRQAYTNKGSYGKILIIAGSKGMAGAAILCAESALRSGCGMVRVYTEESNRQIIQTALKEAIVSTYEDKLDKKGLQNALEWCDAVAIGPGLSRSDLARDILLYTIEHSDVPMVIDADALNILSKDVDMLSNAKADVVITPHLGEMERLTGIPVSEISGHLISAARDFSKSYSVITVLKDARTVISSPKGEVIVNINGNNGMATAGSGDVLTGIIASIRARGLDSFTSAALGCAIHGRAGDLAKDAMGEDHMIAGDIINYIR